MSSTAQYPAQNNVSYPALHLYPLDDSFIPKRIALTGPRVKIARPPNTKTQPAERNGYFDSRVLSRQHAEVWEEGNKIFIKDVKSSNGTFINGERLSLEGRESEPFELKSDDILEFGVDIVSEDNKTVLHRKVVARVACYFPKQGAAAPPSQDQFATMSSHSGATYLNGGVQRRPQVPMIHQGLAGLGGMGGGIRAPGRGLTLDHIFSRLQAELAKSRDTGNDLQVLTGTLNNIEDTLNGALPPTSLPQFPDVLPGVRPPQPVSVPSLPSQAPAAETAPTDAIAALQVQLLDHQAALAAHVDGIRALEGVLAEQEAMKREVRELREFVGVDRREEEEEEESKADD
ncbi:SMAD/FHA domain-containing protein, partial [Mycena sp. CBHHK59/15]